jgi:hypothetical protein
MWRLTFQVYWLIRCVQYAGCLMYMSQINCVTIFVMLSTAHGIGIRSIASLLWLEPMQTVCTTLLRCNRTDLYRS